MAKWVKGQSGNPGGRPKTIGHLRDLVREHTNDAIATLAQIMGDENAPPDARIRAAEALLNRAWGKPPATMEVNGGVAVYSVAEAIRLAEARRLAASGPCDTQQVVALPAR